MSPRASCLMMSWGSSAEWRCRSTFSNQRLLRLLEFNPDRTQAMFRPRGTSVTKCNYLYFQRFCLASATWAGFGGRRIDDIPVQEIPQVVDFCPRHDPKVPARAG